MCAPRCPRAEREAPGCAWGGPAAVSCQGGRLPPPERLPRRGRPRPPRPIPPLPRRGTASASASAPACAHRLSLGGLRNKRALSERTRPRVVFHPPLSKLGNVKSCGKGEPGQSCRPCNGRTVPCRASGHGTYCTQLFSRSALKHGPAGVNRGLIELRVKLLNAPMPVTCPSLYKRGTQCFPHSFPLPS